MNLVISSMAPDLFRSFCFREKIKKFFVAAGGRLYAAKGLDKEVDRQYI